MRGAVQRFTEGCVEVHGGVQRGAWRCVWRCAEVHGGVCGGAWRCVQRCAEGFVFSYHWLPLATIDLVGDNREFEV